VIRGLAVVALVAGCDLVFSPAGRPGADAGPDLRSCPDGYMPITGAPDRYRFVETAASWRESEKTCTDDSDLSQTHLVVFASYDELAAVRGAATFVGIPWAAWTGYGRNSTDDPTMFTAVTGAPLSPVSNLWEPGEPDGGPEQGVWIEDRFDLRDAPAEMAWPAICECDGRPETVTFDVP
jgi:hypothetical protein